MTNYRKFNTNILLYSLSLLFLLIIEIFYQILDREVLGADINLVHREIETIDKLILNGFFGHFFRYKYLNVINIIAVPFLINDLINFRKMENWKRAFLFIYLSVLILVGLKGYFNPRYTLTLFPITIPYIFYSFYVRFKNKKFYKYKRAIPIILIIISLIFFSKEYIKTKFTPNYYQEYIANQKYTGLKNGPTITNKKDRTNYFNSLFGALILSDLPDYRYNPHYFNKHSNYSQKMIFDSINYYNEGKKILCNNLPGLYYYTDINALYYWSGDDEYYNSTGRNFLFTNRTDKQVYNFLKDSVGIKYIYTFEQYNRYNPRFLKFLKESCIIVEQNIYGYQLFKIK